MCQQLRMSAHLNPVPHSFGQSWHWLPSPIGRFCMPHYRPYTPPQRSLLFEPGRFSGALARYEHLGSFPHFRNRNKHCRLSSEQMQHSSHNESPAPESTAEPEHMRVSSLVWAQKAAIWKGCADITVIAEEEKALTSFLETPGCSRTHVQPCSFTPLLSLSSAATALGYTPSLKTFGNFPFV